MIIYKLFIMYNHLTACKQMNPVSFKNVINKIRIYKSYIICQKGFGLNGWYAIKANPTQQERVYYETNEALLFYTTLL